MRKQDNNDNDNDNDNNNADDDDDDDDDDDNDKQQVKKPQHTNKNIFFYVAFLLAQLLKFITGGANSSQFPWKGSLNVLLGL